MQEEDIIMYTVKEIKKIFKCSLKQAYNIVNANGFSSIKIGGTIFVEKYALKTWLEKNKGKAIAIG